MGLYSARMHFADDISLLAELLSLLIPVLEAFAEEAAAIGLEVNWDKIKVQALGGNPTAGHKYIGPIT